MMTLGSGTLLFYLAFFISISTAFGKPSFTKEPQDVKAIEGTTTEFHCDVDDIQAGDTENFNVVWQMNTTSNNYMYIHIDNVKYMYNQSYSGEWHHSLRINYVSLSDKGHYKCLVYKSGEFIMWSRAAKLSVVPPPFREQPRDQIAVEGDAVVLPCRFDDLNEEKLEVHWMMGVYAISHQYDILHIVPQSRYVIPGDKGSGRFDLEIHEVVVEDSDVFTCVVYRQQQPHLVTHSVQATVLVLQPKTEQPTCRIMNPEKSYTAGDVIATACMAREKSMTVSLSWLRNDEVISGTPVRSGFSDILDHWILSASDNGAVITCVAEGRQEDRLCTIGPVEVLYPPIVAVAPRMLRTQVGETKTVTCSARSNPKEIQYQWLIDGQPLREGLTHGIFDVKSLHNVLIITQISAPDNNQSVTFTSTCHATNVVGSSTANVTIATKVYGGGQTATATPEDTKPAEQPPKKSQSSQVCDNGVTLSLTVVIACLTFLVGLILSTTIHRCLAYYRRKNKGLPNFYIRHNNELEREGASTDTADCRRKENAGNTEDRNMVYYGKHNAEPVTIKTYKK